MTEPSPRPERETADVIPLRRSGRRTDDRRTREPRGSREPLWRDVVGDVLRHERTAQERTLREVADEARVSLAYLSEIERGRKEASSEVLAAAAHALGLALSDVLRRAYIRTAGDVPRQAPGAPRGVVDCAA